MSESVVAQEGMDAGVPAHYGDPAEEQWALGAGRAVVDLSHHGVVTVSGADRLTWLTTLSSQKLSELKPGDSAETMFLDPQGRISQVVGVIDDGETTWLLTEVNQAAELVSFLERMKFMLRVEVTDRSSDVATLGLIYPLSPLTVEVPELLAQPSIKGKNHGVWVDPWPGITDEGASYTVLPAGKTHPGLQRKQVCILVDRDKVEDITAEILQALAEGLPITTDDGRVIRESLRAGVLAWEALRVETWKPRQGTEVDERCVPHELDWLRTAVHLTKGCYCGQETVARIINLGKPPRRLVFLDIDGSEGVLPDPGADIVSKGRKVGKLTSVVRHSELGPIGLAVVRRASDIKMVEINDIAANVTPIVSIEGKSDHSPAQRPGADLRGNRLRL